tara:strand:+ start:93 stop:494 length:402 start_codon:yes stop_codon:yes gene_type:complete
MKRILFIITLAIATCLSTQVTAQVNYKVFTTESPDVSVSSVTYNELVMVRVKNDDSEVRMITTDREGNVTDDRAWVVTSINYSNDKWTVYRVKNDQIVFDIICFSQSNKGGGLVIFDYLNGAHTEMTGEGLDY